MTYILSFLPEVEDDVTAGYSWYEKKAYGLGEEFIRVFYARAGEIPRYPLLYPVIYNGFRRCLLKRFPYAIYSGSPFGKERMPFFVQFIPRSNTTALYEMVGVNVVDTSPSEIATRFETKWRDIMAKAKDCDIEDLYSKRFVA